MEKFSLQGITLNAILDTRRVKEDLVFPVRFRVTYNRQSFYYVSGIDLTEEQWAIIDTTKKRDLIETRGLIQMGFDKVKFNIIEMAKEEGFSFAGLNQRLKRNKQNSVFVELLARIERLESEQRPGTASSNRCAYNNMRRFTKSDLKFGDITVEWLQKYENWMLQDGLSLTTVYIYMRTLRALLNENRTFITNSQYPFGKDKYQIKKSQGRKMALTLSQINEILKLKLPTEEAKKYRDLWYFSFLCNGINISDLLRLKYSDIHNNEISFLRQKTIRTNNEQKKIFAPILPPMKRIIEKWGDPDTRKDNFIFPYLKKDMTANEMRMKVQDITRRINRRMKTIGESLGYGNISTYSARHSFASVLKHNSVNIAFISESLGHSDLATTSAYLSSFDDVERASIAKILIKRK